MNDLRQLIAEIDRAKDLNEARSILRARLEGVRLTSQQQALAYRYRVIRQMLAKKVKRADIARHLRARGLVNSRRTAYRAIEAALLAPLEEADGE